MVTLCSVNNAVWGYGDGAVRVHVQHAVWQPEPAHLMLSGSCAWSCLTAPASCSKASKAATWAPKLHVGAHVSRFLLVALGPGIGMFLLHLGVDICSRPVCWLVGGWVPCCRPHAADHLVGLGSTCKHVSPCWPSVSNSAVLPREVCSTLVSCCVVLWYVLYRTLVFKKSDKVLGIYKASTHMDHCAVCCSACYPTPLWEQWLKRWSGKEAFVSVCKVLVMVVRSMAVGLIMSLSMSVGMISKRVCQGTMSPGMGRPLYNCQVGLWGTSLQLRVVEPPPPAACATTGAAAAAAGGGCRCGV